MFSLTGAFLPVFPVQWGLCHNQNIPILCGLGQVAAGCGDLCSQPLQVVSLKVRQGRVLRIEELRVSRIDNIYESVNYSAPFHMSWMRWSLSKYHIS